MPHFTVVPVDGPRRGDYDNLEGLSWVDYGERAEREDSDGKGAPGGALGGDGGAGHAGPALTQAPGSCAHTSMPAQLFLVCPAATNPSLRARRQDFPGPQAPAVGPLSPPQLLPCGRRAGAADVADGGGQASGAARRLNCAEPPPLASPGWEHSRSPDPSPFTFCKLLSAPSLLAYPFAHRRLCH